MNFNHELSLIFSLSYTCRMANLNTITSVVIMVQKSTGFTLMEKCVEKMEQSALEMVATEMFKKKLSFLNQ